MAKCVLCQQELSTEAKDRLTAFEAFVRGKLEKEAKLTETSRDQLLEAVPELETPEAFATRLDSVQISDEASRAILNNFHGTLAARANAILNDKPLEPLPSESDLSFLEALATGLEEKAKKLDEDAKAEGKEALRSDAKELTARKWVSEQKTAIIAECNRLKDVAALDVARKTLNTKALSDKKTVLTNELITEAFVARFQAELKALGAPRLKVTIKKTDTKKGQVLHQVQLIAAHGDAKTGSVLSEGEARVVSLAAFLADSEGGDVEERLVNKLYEALMQANACADVRADDSVVTDPILVWREAAWKGLTDFPIELARYGLLDSFVKSWDLSTRVSELRTRISKGIAAGRIGGAAT